LNWKSQRILEWTVRDLAKAAGIHHNTVNSFETERYAGRPETIASMRKALEKAGVEFINGKKPGVRLG
jgi:DNA-binding XRE family transcriptional regulator